MVNIYSMFINQTSTCLTHHKPTNQVIPPLEDRQVLRDTLNHCGKSNKGTNFKHFTCAISYLFIFIFITVLLVV